MPGRPAKNASVSFMSDPPSFLSSLLRPARLIGTATVGTDTPFTLQTGFNVGSVSESLAAWGTMKLVEEDRIELRANADSLVEATYHSSTGKSSPLILLALSPTTCTPSLSLQPASKAISTWISDSLSR